MQYQLTKEIDLVSYHIGPLSTETWDAYEKLILKHHGVWGGCFCTQFHEKTADYERSFEGHKAFKRKKVIDGKAQAALVFQDETCVGWAHYFISHIKKNGLICQNRQFNPFSSSNKKLFNFRNV